MRTLESEQQPIYSENLFIPYNGFGTNLIVKLTLKRRIMSLTTKKNIYITVQTLTIYEPKHERLHLVTKSFA